MHKYHESCITIHIGECICRLNKLFEKAFANFKLLDDNCLNGIATAPGVTSVGTNENALRLTTQLYEMVNDMTNLEQQKIVQKCIREAARGCCDRAQSVSQQSGSPGGLSDEQSAYESLRVFCSLLKNEADRDIQMEKTMCQKHLLPGVFSGDTRLPALTCSVYTSQIKSRLKECLEQCLPRNGSEKTQDAVDELTEFELMLSAHNLLYTSAGGRLLHVREHFDPFVRQWLSTFKRNLDSARQEQMGGLRGGNEALRASTAWFHQAKAMLNEFERTLTRWPEYATDVEEALAETIGTILQALQKQVQPHIRTIPASSSSVASTGAGQVNKVFRMMSRAGSTAFDGSSNSSSNTGRGNTHSSRSRSIASQSGFDRALPSAATCDATAAESSSPVSRLPADLIGALVALKVIDTEQAELKASLFRFAGSARQSRRHEATASADGDGTSTASTSARNQPGGYENEQNTSSEDGAAAADERSSYLGQHFDARLQPGVRTLYKSCLQEAVSRVSRPVIEDPHTSPRLILRHLGRDRIYHHVKPLESTVASVVRDCASVTCSARATVSLARGFWDKLAGEVLTFITDEMKSKGGGWHKATAAASLLESLKAAVRDAIAESVSDARETDYQDTSNAREASSLLGNNQYSSLHVY